MPESSAKSTKADYVAGLMLVLRDPMRLWRILMHLSKSGKGLLWTIHAGGGNILFDDESSIDPPSQVPLKSITELLNNGLLVIYPDDTAPKNHSLAVIPREIYLLITPPPSYVGSLGEWLSTLPLEDRDNDSQILPSLWQIARSHNLNLRHTLPVLKELIRHRILNLQYLHSTYHEQLSTSEQQLLKILSIKNRPLGLEELRNEWLHFRWSVDVLDMSDILKKLQNRGLLLVIGPKGEVSGRRVIIPQDLGFIIRNNFTKDYRSPSVLRKTYYLREPSVETPDLHEESTAADDLVTLMSYLLSEDVSLLGSEPKDPFSGRVHRKHWRRLTPDLKYRGDDAIEYLNFLFRFARFEQLITKRADKPVLKDENVQLLSDPYRLGVRMIAYWICGLDKDSKLPRDRLPRSKSGKSLETPALQWQVRQSLLGNLNTLPAHRWINIDSYLYTLTQEEITIIETEDSSQSLATQQHIRDDLWHSLYSILDWIGVIRVLLDPDGNDTFCVTPFGSNLLKARKSVIESQLPHLENNFLVLANLETILPPDLNPAVRFRLCQFVELRGNHCVLTRDSIRRGLDSGWTKDALKDFLITHSRSDLPDNVIKFIEEVSDRHGHITIHAGKKIIETRDSWLMTEIKARRTITPYIAQLQSPKKANITPGKDPRRLLILLRKAGYFPRWIP